MKKKKLFSDGSQMIHLHIVTVDDQKCIFISDKRNTYFSRRSDSHRSYVPKLDENATPWCISIANISQWPAKEFRLRWQSLFTSNNSIYLDRKRPVVSAIYFTMQFSEIKTDQVHWQHVLSYSWSPRIDSAARHFCNLFHCPFSRNFVFDIFVCDAHT